MGNGIRASIERRDNHSIEFLIRHEKLDLRISLWPSQLLLLHEETIPDRIAELKNAFLRDEIAKDPVIVDRDSAVVLDGMHRVVALRELGCVSVPVCAVDYMNPCIRVGVWYRALSGPVNPSQFETALAPFGIRIQGVSTDMTAVRENLSPTLVLASQEHFRLSSEELGAYEVLRLAERCARELHVAVAFETEQDAIEKLRNGTTNAIMTVPKIDKPTVRKAGLTRRLLPHKVTRHVIPTRPLRVNVPLTRLIDDTISLPEANRQFVTNLQMRGITRNPSGTVIESRRYEEETLVFN